MDQVSDRLGNQQERSENKKRRLFAACDFVPKADIAVIRNNSHPQRADRDKAGQ